MYVGSLRLPIDFARIHFYSFYNDTLHARR